MKFILALLFFFSVASYAQDLDYGQHKIGFSIIKLTDSTRVEAQAPEVKGKNKFREVYLHLWYPTESNSASRMTSETYISSRTMDENLQTEDLMAKSTVHGTKGAIRSWYGAFTDDKWNELLNLKWKAIPNAGFSSQRFPLLIGELRPTSTFITNEYLASHGYVVAYIRHHPYEAQSHEFYPQMSRTYINMSRDMEFATHKLRQMGIADSEKLGTAGFSGSGFAQVHFAMNNPDVDAIADIESGYFMEGLYEGLTALSSYDPYALRVPFLHIFSRKLSEEEIYLDSLYRMKYADIYRLILEKPQHHWDFATEGYLASKVLGNREAVADDVIKSFHVTNEYLVNFFDAILKEKSSSLSFIRTQPTPKKYAQEMVKITYTPAKKGHSVSQLESLFANYRPEEVVEIIRDELQNDSINALSTDMFSLRQIAHEYQRTGDIDKAIAMAQILVAINPEEAEARSLLDNLGYMLMSFEMRKEAEMVFKANIENFPNHHLPRYSLGDLYQKIGMKEKALEQFELGLKLTNTAKGYPAELLNAHKNAFRTKINELKNE